MNLSNGHCKCKSGNQVVSWSEQTIDDWFFDSGIKTIYEPEIPVWLDDSDYLLPDWLILPQHGLDKPVIVEYWGLLRKTNRAAWVESRLPKYLERKHHKESIYRDLEHYHYLGILPEHIESAETMAQFLRGELEKFGFSLETTDEETNTEPEIREAGGWKFRIYQKQT